MTEDIQSAAASASEPALALRAKPQERLDATRFDQAQVIQADRDAAGRVDTFNRVDLKLGLLDDWPIVQELARARLSGIPRECLPKSIGRLHLSERLADGQRMCAHSHYVETGHPLYWPEAFSQYDDSDPYCLEHAIELAESDSSWCQTCVAASLAMPTDQHGETVLDRMADHAENGTMPPEFRADLRALLTLAKTRGGA